jgi:putative ATP-dependent endonuclease of the OLD family
MFLSELKIWNFRKYGLIGEQFEGSSPGISIEFHDGMNVLIGENDSGKSSIIDAIRYTLGTQSGEYTRIDETDFHVVGKTRAQELRIECICRGLTEIESGKFLEWLENEDIGGKTAFVLKVNLNAWIKGNKIFSSVRAGSDTDGSQIDGEARSLLRTTYLKPLRDAEAELIPGRRSRFAQILKAHSLFQKNSDTDHELEVIFNQANQKIEEYFKIKPDDGGASKLMKSLNNYVEAFFPQSDSHSPSVSISGGDLFDILQRLTLTLDENPSGLGASNLLFMATELLLLQSENNGGLKLALIEELEAHLHPQAQLRLIRYLEEKANTGQFILTTHSTTLGSSISLENLIICKKDKTFPMGAKYTKLDARNYAFLHRFLDATKSNLFFARGILIVEGDAENLLIPTLAKIIDRPLHRYGVSIVNVGSTAFSHYVKIFHRENGEPMGFKVALITDMDVKPLEFNDDSDTKQTENEITDNKTKRVSSLAHLKNSEVEIFVSPNWTLEYEIALSSFKSDFYHALLWAEKIENSNDGIPLASLKDSVKTKVSTDIADWDRSLSADARKREKIAYRIYKKYMLDKKVSKAITAQVFAQSLEELNNATTPGLVKTNLKSEKSLEYLLNAIYHVTEPRET